MLNKTYLMMNEIEQFIQKKEKFDYYRKDGFSLVLDLASCKLDITYKGKKYVADIILKEEKEAYWHLSPYKESDFTTSLENGIEAVLLAIQELEE